ncbi:hypothetical protein ACFYU9_15940 [Streptomyces sp. NPDC004327]|uniref:helix-turn-helix domain-containing protein n=1 Tax=Streptomyces sp. NPDC004327 TaxID=3364699 RepID=UPI0036BFAB9E
MTGNHGRQGRQERPIDPANGPLAVFAIELRRLRARSGQPTYRELATWSGKVGSPYSDTTFSTAARGHTLPSLEVVLAYVRACQAYAKADGPRTERAVADWTARWDAVRTELAPPSPAPDEPPSPDADHDEPRAPEADHHEPRAPEAHRHQPRTSEADHHEPRTSDVDRHGPLARDPDRHGPPVPQPDRHGPPAPEAARHERPAPVANRHHNPAHEPHEPHGPSAVTPSPTPPPAGTAPLAAPPRRAVNRRLTRGLAAVAGLVAVCGLGLGARHLTTRDPAAASASPDAVVRPASPGTAPRGKETAGIGGDSRCGRVRYVNGLAWTPCTLAEPTRLAFAVRLTNTGPDPVTVKARLAYVRARVAHVCPGLWGGGVEVTLAPGRSITSPLTACTVPKLPATAFQAKAWVVMPDAPSWEYREMSQTIHVQPDGRTTLWADEA